MPDGSIAVANRLGLGHLAFAVDDVAATLRNVIAHGGSHLGSIVKSTVPGAGEIELTYARDPEGNIIELQRWVAREKRGTFEPDTFESPSDGAGS
jgi:predicted enzyme related to lactoylglutathione lyase